jgi:Uma2 family endonuclease
MSTTAAAVAPGAEDVVVIRDVSWETYCRLNDENESPAVRMNYFGGALEIMSVSSRHETWARKIEALVRGLTEAMELDCESFGSVTMRRKDLRSGLEPDACFYFGPMAAMMRQRPELDLLTDPPPDLAVEIDISRRSLSKFPLYSSLSIREIWRFHQDEIVLFELVDGEYRMTSESRVLPRITGELLTRLLADSLTMPSPEWQRRVRAAASPEPPVARTGGGS